MDLTAVQWGVVIAAFFASLVEYVEAFTIVLAVGVTRSWRSSLLGAAAATLTLAAIIGVFGASLINLIPIEVLQFVIGALLTLFGMKWLRKAILRQSGIKAMRNEAGIYQREVAMLEEEARPAPGSFDPLGFATSYKSVLLEGMEVAFIVISFGTGDRSNASWWPAILGAGLAAVLVMVVGLLLRAPLVRVPENTLKFGVGLMLVAFGTFWAAEGAGVHWLGDPDDLSILGLLAVYSLASYLLVQWLRFAHRRSLSLPQASKEAI